jgi:hypothetical protein
LALLAAACGTCCVVATTMLRDVLPVNAGVLGNLPRGVQRSALNLVVITLDTFRADRLGAYGSTRGLTPHLDRLAREGVIFEATQSVAPLTLPAHCSLFTGRFPPAHGVHENAGILRATNGPATLAESLSRHGFQTGAFVASGVLDPSRGLNRGFARYDAPGAREGPLQQASATDLKLRPIVGGRTLAQSPRSPAGTRLHARPSPAPSPSWTRRLAACSTPSNGGASSTGPSSS